MQHSSSSAAYASLDAARVGEGLYPQLVEAACLLAIDPSPRVAHAGRMALRTADVELIPVSTAASSAPASSLAPAREPCCSLICRASSVSKFGQGLASLVLLLTSRLDLNLQQPAVAWGGAESRHGQASCSVVSG